MTATPPICLLSSWLREWTESAGQLSRGMLRNGARLTVALTIRTVVAHTDPILRKTLAVGQLTAQIVGC